MPNVYKTLRVLIVDADKFSRDLIKDVLDSLGFESKKISCMWDGTEALEGLRTVKVDIVFCTRNMGSIDGVDFVRTLRDPKESPAPGVPIVFCSRQLDRHLVEEIRAVGVNEVVAKPITIKAIESRVRALLEKPRPFLKITDYVGPDRRRVDNDNVPVERRAQKHDTSQAPHKTVDI